ncbi:MAG: zinc ribbon domain-containing protein [Chloroflexi bacterium]|nr:zinc ribbon domain-containing protein [Chloroflexota bacterium]
MKKAHRKSKSPIMRRTSRVYLNDLNAGKAQTVRDFLHLCHDATQYFIDLFWQRQDFSAELADLPTVQRGRDRFNITTRLAQALAKQAKETIRSQVEKDHQRKPQLHHWTVTLYYHFVDIQPFAGCHFDVAVQLTGSGAPRMTIPVHATRHLNRKLTDGWQLSKTLRLGMRKGRLFVDFILEKPRPQKKTAGRVVGMDSNYVNGLIFSDGQHIGQELVKDIRQFPKRKKHTHSQIKSRIGQAIKQLDWSSIRVLVIEDLKHVQRGKRGTFPRTHNRRLSHWLYAYIADVLVRYCEEHGVRLERKHPAYTSQYCHICNRWDRRNRRGDRFTCVHCGYTAHADHNAAYNLELLGLAGVYGLRLLQSSRLQSFG